MNPECPICGFYPDDESLEMYYCKKCKKFVCEDCFLQKQKICFKCNTVDEQIKF